MPSDSVKPSTLEEGLPSMNEGQTAEPPEKFDPVALREPLGLHEWDWLGVPTAWIRYFVHREVLETDGRDQHCALWLWLFILLAFVTYSVMVFVQPLEDRKSPAQTTHYNELGGNADMLHYLPYINNDTSAGPYTILPHNHGWLVEEGMTPTGFPGYQGFNFTAYDLFEGIDQSKCMFSPARCSYFDGPRFSRYPDPAVALEDRRLALFILLPIPGGAALVENSTSPWRLSFAPVDALSTGPEETCRQGFLKHYSSIVPLRLWGPNHTELVGMFYRIRVTRRTKLGRRPNWLGKNTGTTTYEYHLENTGQFVVHLALGPGPGYFLAGALAVTMAPFITDIADVEPVNILATMGIIAGVWSALIMAFKLCFPSGASGRRRLVKPLRRVAWRLMPKAMSRKLAELQSCASPGLNRSCESLDEGFAEEDGGDQGDPPAVQATEERKVDSASKRERSARFRDVVSRTIMRRGSSRSTVSSQDSSRGPSLEAAASLPHKEELVVLEEVPAVHDRVLELERIVKALMLERQQARQMADKVR